MPAGKRIWISPFAFMDSSRKKCWELPYHLNRTESTAWYSKSRTVHPTVFFLTKIQFCGTNVFRTIQEEDMPKRGYTSKDRKIIERLAEKHGTDGSAWRKIEKDFNEEVPGYSRTAGALRTEYLKYKKRRSGPREDKTIQGIIRKLGIVERRILRRSEECEASRSLREKNKELKRSNKTLQAELDRVRSALRPFQRAIARAQNARVVHSETKR